MTKMKVGGLILNLGEGTPVKVLEILRDEILDLAARTVDRSEQERLLEKARGIERHMFERKIPDMTIAEVKKGVTYVKGKIKRCVDNEDLTRYQRLLSLLEYRHNELHYTLYLEDIKRLREQIEQNNYLKTEAAGDQELLSLLSEENRVLRGKLTRREQSVEQVGTIIFAKVMFDANASFDTSKVDESVRKDVLRKMSERLSSIYTPNQDVKK